MICINTRDGVGQWTAGCVDFVPLMVGPALDSGGEPEWAEARRSETATIVTTFDRAGLLPLDEEISQKVQPLSHPRQKARGKRQTDRLG